MPYTPAVLGSGTVRLIAANAAGTVNRDFPFWTGRKQPAIMSPTTNRFAHNTTSSAITNATTPFGSDVIDAVLDEDGSVTLLAIAFEPSSSSTEPAGDTFKTGFDLVGYIPRIATSPDEDAIRVSFWTKALVAADVGASTITHRIASRGATYCVPLTGLNGNQWGGTGTVTSSAGTADKSVSLHTITATHPSLLFNVIWSRRPNENAMHPSATFPAGWTRLPFSTHGGAALSSTAGSVLWRNVTNAATPGGTFTAPDGTGARLRSTALAVFGPAP